ncbi:PEP-CTERM sorting domain-containing protein [Luteolibacter sp. SL250]|uniref:PEP-CTERM sorting domain-containing protein n=1 Tax=Luteolibacter sp. SL250 TaxID=2995170 RepID=UPI0022720939|nr:PEP-CTERM sorting domain-containing protein [Luteolibacter sp. SL250]WAC21487.1 PEP-CTERM sorting domain-containing protein [Luteolibacter sp. SL250]
MKTHLLRSFSALILGLALSGGSASAVTAFTETFNTNASGWLTGNSVAPTYSATGGVGNSGYISFTSTFTSGASGPFGAPPLQTLIRGNASADASGDAFAGNWITSGVTTMTVAVRHNYNQTLNLYARLDAGGGNAASLASTASYAVASDTWTTITIPITNSNPPFLSYGGGDFNSVFGNIQNVQLGFYLPANTTFTDFRIDVDNVSVAVPEPASLGLLAVAGAGIVLRRRRLA